MLRKSATVSSRFVPFRAAERNGHKYDIIKRYHLETGKKETVYNSIDDNSLALFGISKDAIYFRKKLLINVETDSGTTVNASGGIIYRYDIESGEVVEWFHDIEYDVFEIKDCSGVLFCTGNRMHGASFTGYFDTSSGSPELIYLD